uniref:C2H2-type domain-containing protein n=1 Tax=Leptobrachium leishanense TaxID=445787 RepID=A0A8C5QAB4_9ANUR
MGGPGGNLTDSDMYEPPEHTQTEYPSTDIKEESPTYGEGNLPDSDMYEPPEHTQTECSADNNGEYVKSNPNPVEINHSESLIESRKPDHRIYYTDPLTQNSVYKGHSAPSSEMGKVSCFETKERPLSCPECEKTFIDQIALKKHQRIHTGKKLFKCSDCGKCFTTSSNLTKHVMIHTGEKPFICFECGKCFNQASSLRAHIRIHTGEKPFKCDECGKCFARSSSLNKRKHNDGGKKFQCAKCGRCFTQTSNLSRHEMFHTG